MKTMLTPVPSLLRRQEIYLNSARRQQFWFWGSFDSIKKSCLICQPFSDRDNVQIAKEVLSLLFSTENDTITDLGGAWSVKRIAIHFFRYLKVLGVSTKDTAVNNTTLINDFALWKNWYSLIIIQRLLPRAVWTVLTEEIALLPTADTEQIADLRMVATDSTLKTIADVAED